MDFYDVVNRRRSIRAYKDTEIPDSSLMKMAETLCKAPSACNFQPFNFSIVKNPETRDRICDCYGRDWLRQAPAIIVAEADMDSCWKRLDGHPIADMDIGIAMEHIVLAAAAENLGTCWICAYDVEALNKALDIQKPWTALAISPLGYPDEKPAPRKSKPVAEIFRVIE
jgi:nitroreductase